MINYDDFRLIPTVNMTFEEKLYTIIKLLLFIGFITTLIFNDVRYILFNFIIIIILYITYLYYTDNVKKLKEDLYNSNLTIMDNKKCVIPTKNNPFMNPSILDIDNNNFNIKNCSIDNKNINNDLHKKYISNVFKDINDIYGRNMSERQFYTMPSTTIPNDREIYTKWLYNIDKTCKENNGVQCSKNKNI